MRLSDNDFLAKPFKQMAQEMIADGYDSSAVA